MAEQAVNQSQSVTEAASTAGSYSEPSDSFDPKDLNYFSAIFYVLLTSMQIRQTTVITESKDLCNNASQQNVLNDQNANVQFSILPTGAKTATINRVQTENQQYAALRENFQNMLITSRQNAQVTMTQTSTNVNILQEDASEDSGYLQTLNTVFQVIDEMTQRS